MAKCLGRGQIRSSFVDVNSWFAQVENHNLAFSPPRKSLHQHLEDMRLEKTSDDAAGVSVGTAASNLKSDVESREE